MNVSFLWTRQLQEIFGSDGLALVAGSIKLAVLGAALSFSLSATAQTETRDSNPVPTQAVPQVPELVNSSSTKPALKLPQIDLNADTKRVDVENLSEYWVDETNQATIEQVDAGQNSVGQFLPNSDAKIHKITGKTLWIRFNANISDARSRWFLELASPSLQDVSLFWRDDKNQWVRLRSGDATPRSRWPVLDRTPVFQLNPQKFSSGVYYLRINNDRVPFSAPIHILRDTEILAKRQAESLFMGAYGGIALMMFIASLVLARSMQDNSFYTYMVYLLVLATFQFNYLGLSGQYIYPNATSWAYSSNFVLPLLAVAVGLWFVRRIIQPRQYSRGIDIVALGLIGMLLGMAVYALLAPNPVLFQIGNLASLASVIWAYVVIWTSWTHGNRHVRWIAIGLLPVALGALPGLLRNAGLIHSGFITQYSLTICAIFGMPLLIFSLVQRSARRLIKLARTTGLPNKDPLTGLSNTRHFLEQIYGATTRALRFKKPYGLFLVELTNHDWFVKEHGEEMGERALVLAGTRLQYLARDVDTAARLETNQFALLAEGPCSARAAAKVSAQIIASARLPSNLLPIGAMLKLRVTCALMPDPASLQHGDHASAQLAWLMEHADQPAQEPRKQVQTLNF